MIVSSPATLCDGRLLRRLFIASYAWLHLNHKRINAMNVFPVPDGDTGTNMLLTMQRAVKEIETYQVANIGLVSERFANGALIGARGNSGTILSMLLRGFATRLDGHSRMDAVLLRQALHAAVEYTYTTIRAVMEPVEGTILTVAREAVASIDDDETDLRLILSKFAKDAQISLANTPELLPILKESGVVDSGGMGLYILLEGMQRFINGEEIPVIHATEATMSANGFRPHNPHQSLADILQAPDGEGYGYDVQFLMRGEMLDIDRIRKDIAAMGWSPLVDGNATLIKVHIHVHNPGIPLNYAIEQGAVLDDIIVENMQLQSLAYIQSRTQEQSDTLADKKDMTQSAYLEQIANSHIAVIAVVNGQGLSNIFRQYGAHSIIVGGQTMNPSTDDFLQEIEKIDAHEIILLPNNRNIIMTAQQARHMVTGKDIRVVETRSIPQGINALLAYGDATDDHTLDDMIALMKDRVQHTIGAEITTATRAVILESLSVNEGDYIGLQDGKIVVASPIPDDIVIKLIAHILSLSHSIELVTIYTGQSVSPALLAQLRLSLAQQFPDIDFEMLDGGQPLYPFIMSFE